MTLLSLSTQSSTFSHTHLRSTHTPFPSFHTDTPDAFLHTKQSVHNALPTLWSEPTFCVPFEFLIDDLNPVGTSSFGLCSIWGMLYDSLADAVSRARKWLHWTIQAQNWKSESDANFGWAQLCVYEKKDDCAWNGVTCVQIKYYIMWDSTALLKLRRILKCVVYNDYGRVRALWKLVCGEQDVSGKQCFYSIPPIRNVSLITCYRRMMSYFGVVV